MFRALIEHLSRDLAFNRPLPARVGGGRVVVSPDASLKLWRWNLNKAEPRLFDWAEELVGENDVVWDIGANVGLFALAAASLSGTQGFVLAVEADDWLAELLRRSTGMSNAQCARMEVLSAAASNESGLATFNVSARGRSTSHLGSVKGSTQTGGVRYSVQVPTVTLDSLLETRIPPTVLKIDVEGAEYEVLEGGLKLLDAGHPDILCEVSSENATRVGRLLHSLDYELFDLDQRVDSRVPLEIPTFNTLARFNKVR